MAKIPKNPRDIFPEITEDFKKVFGEDLISLILYGSGARGDYVPGKSDLNLLIILSQGAVDHLDKMIETANKWRKRKVAAPLVMTRQFVLSSVDAYPIEFLNMKISHVVIFGENVLDELKFNPVHLRLQLERELKGKLLNLQTGFLETEGKSKQIRELIKVSFNAFIALFNAMLFLKNIAIPQGKRNIIQLIAQTFSIDAVIFLKCADIRDDMDNYSSADIHVIFRSYLQVINKLSEIIDHMMEDHKI